MGNPIVIACLVAAFSWWFFTGAILLAVRLCDRYSTGFRTKITLAVSPLFLFGFFGLWFTSFTNDVASVYFAFLSALGIWGWIEFAFLTGVITGPNTTECPRVLLPFERFIRAWGTLAYHEILLLVSLLVVLKLSWATENTFGMWTFIVLYAARVFAKLNLFFGVPRINLEFVPQALEHLKSYFKIAALNWFFPVSVTLLTFALACWIERIYAVSDASDIIGFTLLATMTAMALVEHWVMVLPVPDARLWRWMLPDNKNRQDICRKDYHGL
jgi:putative photosynthetic complex assembly protein 2